jgi:predicted short-subunit dehydrogenase-like oxidoreductase (DUF2520 family)
LLGNKYFFRKEENSSTYHLANVFVSNLTLSLLDMGTSYLKKLGLNDEEALNALKPLVKGNIDSIYAKGFVNALTGPIARGDISTIEKHISALDAKDTELYKILSLNLLKLVALRDKEDVDITENIEKCFYDLENRSEIENILSNSKKHLEIYRFLGGVN